MIVEIPELAKLHDTILFMPMGREMTQYIEQEIKKIEEKYNHRFSLSHKHNVEGYVDFQVSFTDPRAKEWFLLRWSK